MPEIKGKFITLTGMLMNSQPQHLEKANQYLKEETGLLHLELDPEDFYDTAIWDQFMKIYNEASGEGEQGYITIGKRIYPTIKMTSGFPEHLKTPLDFVKYEAEGFLANHSEDVTPRKFLKAEERDVEVYAPAPGYNSKLYEGVFLGILELCGIEKGKVENTAEDTFRITW